MHIKAIQRLLRLRELEEEQSRRRLEAATRQLSQIELAMESAVQRQVQSRENFLAAVTENDVQRRVGSILDMGQGVQHQRHIEPTLRAIEIEVVSQRAEFLSKRTYRQQVETLIANARQRADADTTRRAQQMLDDWYGRRTRPKNAKAKLS